MTTTGSCVFFCRETKVSFPDLFTPCAAVEKVTFCFYLCLCVFICVSAAMFCEKAVELIRELHRMSDGQLPAFSVS